MMVVAKKRKHIKIMTKFFIIFHQMLHISKVLQNNFKIRKKMHMQQLRFIWSGICLKMRIKRFIRSKGVTLERRQKREIANHFTVNI